MKRILGILLLAFAPAAFAAQLSVTPERPVSNPVLAPAAGDQHVRGVASNDQIALSVWDDGRGGNTDLYASRIDVNGVVLDPSGILIPRAAGASAVVWNGSAFVIVTPTEMVFVSPDGAIVKRTQLEIPDARLIAVSGSGTAVRFLFLSGAKGFIFDGTGRNILPAFNLISAGGPDYFVGGGSDSEFLVLFKSIGQVFASRFDRDGKLLSSVTTNIDQALLGYHPSVAGSADGWIVVGRTIQQTAVFALDHGGVLAASPVTLDGPQQTYETDPPAVVAAEGKYLVVWTTTYPDVFSANAVASTSIAEFGANGTLLAHPMHPHDSYPGAGFEAAATRIGSRWLVVSSERRGKGTGIDGVARLLTDSLDELLPPYSMIFTPTRQGIVKVASTKDNYAVLWTEFGPDTTMRLLLRRFALDSTPIDPVPLVVTADFKGGVVDPQFAGAGDTYVVVWPDHGDISGLAGYSGRRLSASTGIWIDAAPFAFDSAIYLLLASNVENALAVYGSADGWKTRVVAASGPALPAPERMLGVDFNPLALAANGQEFLIAGTNACLGYCDYFSAVPVMARRLLADGSPLDGQSLILGEKTNVDSVAAAWNGSRWVVLWTNYGTLFGTHISATGVVSDSGTRIATIPLVGYVEKPTLVASGRDLTFIAPQAGVGGSAHATSLFSIDSDSLALRGGGPQTMVAENRDDLSAGAAVIPGGVALAYDHIDASASNVLRVFTRIVSGTIERRRAAR